LLLAVVARGMMSPPPMARELVAAWLAATEFVGVWLILSRVEWWGLMM